MIVEVCAGSVEDCVVAEACGASRIELNSGLFLGGLTPSVGMLIEAKKRTTIPIITMVRPRGGGFCYSELEVETMICDARLLIEHGTDGLVFGFLNEDSTVDKELTRFFVNLCKDKGIEAIFHRAFDRVKDPVQAMDDLVDCGVDRVLTSGLEASAENGIKLLKHLQEHYAEDIELCVGAGVNQDNALKIIRETGICQLHSSFKVWHHDPTTHSDGVSYRYSEYGDYEGVGFEKLKAFIEKIKCNE